LIEENAGRTRDADTLFRKSLETWCDIGDKHGSARTVEGIARVTAILGNEKSAARIFGAADAIRRSIAAPLSPAERNRYGHLRDSLRKKFPAQWKEGSQRSPDDVIA
jgi:hypothetical protein